MNFFNKIKSKLKTKNLLWSIFFILFAIGSFAFAMSNGFSSETQWQLGVRGSDSGIPLPNWLVSCFMLLVCAITAFSAYAFIKSFFKDTEFNKMMGIVAQMGDVNYIGNMLESMPKNPYAKGTDLRFNEAILFCMSGTDVKVIHPATIHSIRGEVTSNKEYSVCVYYDKEVLKIKTNKKNIQILIEQMRSTLSVYS